MAIAATRMHRSLVGFAFRSTDVSNTDEHPQNGNVPVQEIKRTNSASIPMDRLEFTVHVVSEQHETSRIGEVDSCISTGEQIYEKRNGLGHYDDMEPSM